MATALRGAFVTGTGTEVGKTVVAAVLARAEAQAGARVGAYKPAASGLEELPSRRSAEPRWADARALADHELLHLACGGVQGPEVICPRTFGPAVSPHLATSLAAEEPLVPAEIEAAAWRAAHDAEAFVCEGVGGALVPLSLDPDYLVRDLIVALGLPAVVVANPGLGTINHALLTIEALRSAEIEIDRVVFNPWPADPGALERSNLETIAALGECTVEVLGELELTDPDSWPTLGPLPTWQPPNR